MNKKKSAVDLTDLAIGIVVLGIVVSIGAYILSAQRDSLLEDLSTNTISNETFTATNATGGTQTQVVWYKAFTRVVNVSSHETIDAGNYTIGNLGNGHGTITFLPGSNYTLPGNSVAMTYDVYNTTSRIDYELAGDAATGLAEYGNWFKIIVIVGVAAVVLALIFMAFGDRGARGEGIGGSY